MLSTRLEKILTILTALAVCIPVTGDGHRLATNSSPIARGACVAQSRGKQTRRRLARVLHTSTYTNINFMLEGIFRCIERI